MDTTETKEETSKSIHPNIYSPEMKLTLVREYLASGEPSEAAFARSRGIPKNTFYGWMKKTRDAEGDGAVQVRNPAQPKPIVIEEGELKRMHASHRFSLTINGTEVSTDGEGLAAIVRCIRSC